MTINSDDNSRYDTTNIRVPTNCTDFTVMLNHIGKRPLSIMGHNWVLSTRSDAFNIYRQGRGAGLENSFILPGDERVLAATEMIGGGETTTTTFPVSLLDKNKKYAFFCSFPGHINSMLGTLELSDE